jgi:hypothetical protein
MRVLTPFAGRGGVPRAQPPFWPPFNTFLGNQIQLLTPQGRHLGFRYKRDDLGGTPVLVA